MGRLDPRLFTCFKKELQTRMAKYFDHDQLYTETIRYTSSVIRGTTARQWWIIEVSVLLPHSFLTFKTRG